jgi:hypothetical protein
LSNNKRVEKREGFVTALLVLLAVTVAAYVFSVGLRHIPVSTDESIIALQARHIGSTHSDKELLHSLHPKPLFFRFPLLFLAQPYLFPLEAYIAAPFAPFLPTGPLGARAVPFAMGIITLVVSFLVLRRLGPWREAWPGALLLIFPSTYVAMLQFGYALPSYPSHLLLLALGIWLTVRYIEEPGLLRALLIAAICAMALAGQLMALPLVMICGVLILWAGPGWRRLVHSFAFGVTAALGFIPYVLARKLYPGAYDAVSGSWPLREALGRIWAPLLNHVLPVASGIQSTVFPDNLEHVEWLPWLTLAWPFIWISLLSLGMMLWLWQFIRNRFSLQADKGQAFIAFIGLSVAAVCLFALSRRSHSHTYRYMLTAAWALPFVIAYIHARISWKLGRWLLGGLAVLLAAVNAVTVVSVMGQWQTPRFAADEAWLHDMRPALEYLESNDLHVAYGSYHLVYRINYATDERIVAAQYFNERFPGWPLPYRSYVDQGSRPAYVMAPRFAITADKFESDLIETGIEFVKANVGDLSVFHDFRWDAAGDWLDASKMRASASHAHHEASFLIDGQTTQRWRAGGFQEQGMWVAIEWDESLPVAYVYMFYDFFRHDRAEALVVEVKENNDWRAIGEPIEMGLCAVLFDQGRPLYGHEFQRIGLNGVTTTGVRIRIERPAEERDWAIGEIRLRGPR